MRFVCRAVFTFVMNITVAWPEKSSLLSGKEKLLEIREELGEQLVKESSRVIELEILVQKMQTEIAVLKGQVRKLCSRDR